ncbi:MULTISPECIES: hypothetical protein [Vibrio]|uniref:hypothetical protein n=1 Tax=Vibrio TaxID=662 RepID=UPI0004AF76B0|nr:MULTISPECIES: hypothetical protein [Vibrio]MBS9832910.1 hypothetical protein [Vibrio alginolyticus]MDA0099299.1 hypothetical protein [Vibrio sp. ART SEL2]ULF70574.1 hypothetical protein K6745_20335 [Vibrio alginolyticus]
MTNLLRSVDNSHKGLQLLLGDFYKDFSSAAINIEMLHKQNRFEELSGYSKKLKTILVLLCDEDLPPKIAKLEHLSKHHFPAPEDLLEDIRTELNNVNKQISQLLNIEKSIDDNADHK